MNTGAVRVRPSILGWTPATRPPAPRPQVPDQVPSRLSRTAPPAQPVALSVVVCDARLLFAEALTRALEARGAWARATADPEVALGMLDEDPAHRVVLSADFSSISGVALVGRIRERWPATQVFCTAAHGATLDPVVRAYAREVLCTRRPLHELVDGVLRPDDVPVPSRLADFVPAAGQTHRRAAPEPLPARFLSKREREVLGLLVSARSTTDMARELGISVTTTRGHVRSIFFKLGVRSRIEAVGYAIRHSLVVA